MLHHSIDYLKSVANPGANPSVPTILLLSSVIKFIDGESIDVIFLAILWTILRMGEKRINL